MKYKSASQQLLPFLLLGIAIALLIGLFVIFAYVITWGLVIGSAFWLIAVIKQYVMRQKIQKKSGRVIDYDPHE